MFKHKKTQWLVEPGRKMRIRIGIEPIPEKCTLKAKRLALDEAEKNGPGLSDPGPFTSSIS
jgi:hypothetical protein